MLPGHSYTYVLYAGDDSAGVWPYHDHSPSMEDSLERRMYCMLSILVRHRANPRPRVRGRLLFLWDKDFMTIDGRAFVGNTPVFRAKVGQLVQWDVMAIGSDFHTFHVHAPLVSTQPTFRATRILSVLPNPFVSSFVEYAPVHVALPLPRRGSHDAAG